MLIKFTLPCRAFSVNAYYYRDQRVKTAEARAWEREVLKHIAQLPDLKLMGDRWKDIGGRFRVRYCAIYPEYIYYTKQGALSARAFDITNFEKPIQDLVFRYGMTVDDRHVTHMISSKESGADYAIEVEIELLPIK